MQLYSDSGLQTVDGLGGLWTSDGIFFFFPPVNSFVSQDDSI